MMSGMAPEETMKTLYRWRDEDHVAVLRNDPRQAHPFLTLESGALDDIDYDASVYVEPEHAEGLATALLATLTPEAVERVRAALHREHGEPMPHYGARRDDDCDCNWCLGWDEAGGARLGAS